MVAFDICMIATVKLVRPDELLSLIREAADCPAPYGSADAARERHNVRFWGQSRHDADVLRCLLLTLSGHERLRSIHGYNARHWSDAHAPVEAKMAKSRTSALLSDAFSARCAAPSLPEYICR